MVIAMNTTPICHQVGEGPISTITVEIAPGPASMGMPRGIMPASSLLAPSAVSPGVSWVADRRACNISSPMRMRMMPPAISNAGKVMPKRRKMRLPASANALNTMKHVSAAFLARRRCSPCPASAVMTRNAGIAANGSTRKKIEVSVTRKY